MKFLLIGLVAFAVSVLVVVRLLRNRGRTGEARPRLRRPRLMDELRVPPVTSPGTPVAQPSRSLDKLPPAEPGKRHLQITGVSISLYIEEKQSLFILLASDGTINRMGTGAIDNQEHGLYIGRTDTAIFEKVRSHFTDEILQHMGGYQLQNPQGAACKLTIALKFLDGIDNGFQFLYGAESQGPPTEIADIVRAAVHETDSWHENFKRNAARSSLGKA